ncbi:MAG: type I-MYXAN CRISPR-associated protein Cas6/Cmx6 [Betaproteobacteria bacterium]|nr:type I-MYXAN CRISPR-associated protein Cas6/Cmx6 [Betaproteobacteria bacterium]
MDKPTGPSHVDMAFAVSGDELPRDHSLALWQALVQAAPWIGDDDAVAVLPIRAASAGGDRLVVHRRSRLLMRLPEARVEAALALSGRRLEVADAPLTLGDAKTRPLVAHATLYAHRVAAERDDEERFVKQAERELDRLGVRNDCIVGRRTLTRGPAGVLAGYSLMLADLPARQSLALQVAGIGAHRGLGFGIFVGHK